MSAFGAREVVPAIWSELLFLVMTGNSALPKDIEDRHAKCEPRLESLCDSRMCYNFSQPEALSGGNLGLDECTIV
jgi:hypothetical protein